TTYPTETLRDWKEAAEADAVSALGVPMLTREEQPTAGSSPLQTRFSSVKEERIDTLQRAMREAAIWLNRITNPSVGSPSQDVLHAFERAYSDFQRARLLALLFVSGKTATDLEQLAQALHRARRYRWHRNLDGWSKAEDQFEIYVQLMGAVEEDLRS